MFRCLNEFPLDMFLNSILVVYLCSFYSFCTIIILLFAFLGFFDDIWMVEYLYSFVCPELQEHLRVGWEKSLFSKELNLPKFKIYKKSFYQAV